MTGFNNFRLQDVLWTDAEMEKIEIDYGSVTLTITESTERRRKISFKGYTAYSVSGFWDEVVVKSSYFTSSTFSWMSACRVWNKNRVKNCPRRGMIHEVINSGAWPKNWSNNCCPFPITQANLTYRKN